jgi:hypothetical protein
MRERDGKRIAQLDGNHFGTICQSERSGSETVAFLRVTAAAICEAVAGPEGGRIGQLLGSVRMHAVNSGPF